VHLVGFYYKNIDTAALTFTEVNIIIELVIANWVTANI